MNKIKRHEIFSRLQKDNPKPTTELNFNSTFELLIAVILSAQATDKSVNIATAKLYPVANTPEAIYKLGETSLKKYIKTIGLFNSKAKNIIKTCKILVEEHNSIVPDDQKKLEALPGVGRKTANVVLSIAHNFDAIAVDTHVFRVSNRIGLANAKNVEVTEEHLMQNIPQKDWSAAHHWLIWHGRKICKARNPLCDECFLTEYCLFYQSTQK